jgi:hypothetical protein
VTAESNDSPETIDAPARLRAARTRAGLPESVVATQIGVTMPAYFDLEAFDDEIVTTLSLEQLVELGRTVGVPPLTLIADDVESVAPVTMETFIERLRARIATEGGDVEAFSNRVGWEMQPVLADPSRAWLDWNVDCLRDVSAALDADWRAILKEPPAWVGVNLDALHQAAQDGDVPRVSALVTAGYDPNRFDELGKTPLHYAAAREHIDVASFLLAHGAAVNAHDEATIGNTPLGEVAGSCSLAMATLLIEAGADPSIRGWMQLSALDRAAGRRRGDGPRVFELLCARCAFVPCERAAKQ